MFEECSDNVQEHIDIGQPSIFFVFLGLIIEGNFVDQPIEKNLFFRSNQ